MRIACNSIILEDLCRNVIQFGELLERSLPDDPMVAVMYQEALIHSFFISYKVLNGLLNDMYEANEFDKKEYLHPDDAPGVVITWLYREGIIPHTCGETYIDMHYASSYLLFDRSWIDGTEDQNKCSEYVDSLPHYYRSMSSFIKGLIKHVPPMPVRKEYNAHA